MADLNQPQNTNNSNGPEVRQELSKVAFSPKRSIFIGAISFILLAIAIYYLFFSNNTPSKVSLPPPPSIVVKPVSSASSDVPAIPKLPDPPKLKEPILPPVPVELPAPLPAPLPSALITHEAPLPNATIEADETKKRQEAKRKSKIVLLAGKDDSVKSEKAAEKADLKETGSLDLILGQGKIIDAILESAINSDLSTEIRAIITRDIYSQSDKVVLIPKGSRVFGTFSAGASDDGYGRINISWNKINLSNGYTLNIQATGVDNLGRKGNQGRVDNKYKEQIANTILLSSINVLLAKQVDKFVPPVAATQTSDANTAAAQQLGNIALAIYNNAGISAAQKYQQICSAVANAIPDKTSTSYTTFIAACNTLNLTVGSTDDQKLTSVMSSVNTASAALLLNTVASQSTSHAQDAANSAITDIGNTLKNIIGQEQFKRTVTIDQGTAIKIYVNKDYIFPKAIMNKSKLIP